jgi:hypothetical protein
VSFDVDAPVWTLSGAQHARGAIFLVQSYNSSGAIWWSFFFVWVLNGHCTFLGRGDQGFPSAFGKKRSARSASGYAQPLD